MAMSNSAMWVVGGGGVGGGGGGDYIAYPIVLEIIRQLDGTASTTFYSGYQLPVNW